MPASGPAPTVLLPAYDRRRLAGQGRRINSIEYQRPSPHSRLMAGRAVDAEKLSTLRHIAAARGG